jgi:hypothetical protein
MVGPIPDLPNSIGMLSNVITMALDNTLMPSSVFRMNEKFNDFEMIHFGRSGDRYQKQASTSPGQRACFCHAWRGRVKWVVAASLHKSIAS